MKVTCKYKFLEKVCTLASTEDLIITYIQISADGSYIYGCLTKDGSFRWYKEIELQPMERVNKLGFNISIKGK